MPKVFENHEIAKDVYRMVVEAPDVVKYRKAGQFVMVRPGADRKSVV